METKNNKLKTSLKEEDNDFQKMAKMIKNLPTSCRYCGVNHNKDKIQYIRIYPGRKEAVCDITCAIGFCKREIKQHQESVKTLQSRLKELMDD